MNQVNPELDINIRIKLIEILKGADLGHIKEVYGWVVSPVVNKSNIIPVTKEVQIVQG